MFTIYLLKFASSPRTTDETILNTSVGNLIFYSSLNVMIKFFVNIFQNKIFQGTIALTNLAKYKWKTKVSLSLAKLKLFWFFSLAERYFKIGCGLLFLLPKRCG